MPGPETGRFEELLCRLGGELDSFVASGRADAVADVRRSDPVAGRDVWAGLLNGPVPEVGGGADRVLELLADTVIPAGSRIADSAFWAFITAGPSTTPVLAATAAMVASPQRYTITAFNHIEELSLEWLGEICGLDAGMKGVYSSGGSTANLVALGAARQAAYEQAGVDPAAAGLGDRPAAIYTSTEAHHTIQRAAGVLGIGRQQVRAIPVDDRQRMDVAALRSALEADVRQGVLPVAVAATAGTTNTGAIDPLREVADLAAEYSAWFHVDGAYGLPGVLDDRVADRFEGLERADSVIVDPHKWLGAPVGIGATFVRDRAILHRAFTQEPADYLEGSFAEEDVQMSVDSMGVPYGDMGVELSAPARGIMVWAILVEQGREGLIERIRRDNDRARHLTQLARQHPKLEAVTEPELSIACVRYVGESAGDLSALNQSLLRRLLRETEFLPSGTLVRGEFVIRPCFMNVRTVDAQVEAFAEKLVELGDEISRAGRY